MISIIDSVNVLDISRDKTVNGKVNIISSSSVGDCYKCIEKIDVYKMFGIDTCSDDDPEITHYCYDPQYVNNGPLTHNINGTALIGMFNSIRPEIIIINMSDKYYYEPEYLISVEQTRGLYNIYIRGELHLDSVSGTEKNNIIKSLVRDYIRDYVEPKSIDKRLQALEDKVIHERKSFTIWDDSQHGISNHRMYSITHSSMCKEYSSDGVDNRTLHNLIGCNTSLPIKYYVIGTMSNSTGNGYAMTVGRFLSQHIMNPIIPDIVITNNKDIAYLADKLVIYIDSNSIHVNGELISTESDLNELHKKIRSIICNYIDSNSNDTMLSETDKLKAKNEELTKSLNDEKTKVAELQQKLDEMNSRINKMMAMLSGN